MTLVWIPKPQENDFQREQTCIRVIKGTGSVERGVVARCFGTGTTEEHKMWYPIDKPWREDKYPKFSMWLREKYPRTYKDGKTVREIIQYSRDKK
jgi:hypothetical protein